MSEAIAAKLAAAGLGNPLAVMTGPTIAPELASGVLTTALVASADEAVARQLAEALSTPTFNVQPAADPLGVELWGAFKNVIALACGVSDGLKLAGGMGGDNLKAALFTVGFNEGRRVLAALGAQPETAFSAAGIGDLFVTATSPPRTQSAHRGAAWPRGGPRPGAWQHGDGFRRGSGHPPVRRPHRRRPHIGPVRRAGGRTAGRQGQRRGLRSADSLDFGASA